MTECNGCGSCCNPVILTFTQEEARHHDLTVREKKWIFRWLTPITFDEAKEKADWLRHKEGNFYYSCSQYDEESRRCKNWENRPEPCRGFPWYNKEPRQMKLPPMCSFRADIGEVPVEFHRQTV